MIVAITATIGILAGITTIIRNLLQIANAKKAKNALENESAVKIQRAFRQHRTTRFSYGALKLEFTTEQVPTFHKEEEEPQSQSPAPDEEKKKKKKGFFW